ncbi:MAG TPA: TetR/AcrR family transcriptional regulator [Hyphomonadaceae bacterium]|nr:TetR/AcrR family transcriptional regulator [Hyphomonadaceae bacterium]
MLNRKAEEGAGIAPDRDGDGQAQLAAGRFEKRRSDIVAAAIPVLNGQGFKGMRLTAVAELIGLRATGVTYYFPRKEELAVACLESGLAVFHDLLATAEREPDSRRKVARLIELFFERDAAVRQGEATPLASFSAIRALEGDHRERAVQGYRQMFRRVRALFESVELENLDAHGRSIRAMVLLEQLYWANVWLGDYDLDEFPRLARRMTDIVSDGLAPPGAEFDPGEVCLRAAAATGADAAKDNFLFAATRQINAHGYRGASVDRISASLNLTKGAFYHHNEAKDDLVAACFRRSFGIVREAQRKVRGQGPGEWWRLITAVTSLIRFQLGPEGPLLRTAALSSMPHEHQVEIVSLSYKVSRQFSAMIADAISEGSARPVDPAIAGALINAAINVGADIRMMRRPMPERLANDYARPLFTGLLRP